MTEFTRIHNRFSYLSRIRDKYVNAEDLIIPMFLSVDISSPPKC